MVQNATPRDKPYKMADSGGMYLYVMPTGSKYWRMDYRFERKQCWRAFKTDHLCALNFDQAFLHRI